MTDQISLLFSGHLTAESPISTCPPGTPTRGDNQPAPLPTMSINGVSVPYFPGGGLRGTLRRRSVDLVRNSLLVDGISPFGLDDHYYLVLGGVKGSEKEEKLDILDAHARRLANPITGLFGSGDPWQSGRLYVGHAVPAAGVGVNAIRGARVDDFSRSGDTLQVLDIEERNKWLAMTKANNIRSKKAKEQKVVDRKLKNAKIDPEEKKVLEAETKAFEKEIKDLGEISGYTNAINRPLDGYEVIPQGTEMAHSMNLSFGSMDEIGLLMGTLQFWALDPWIGAHKAHGCGLVRADWTVSMRKGYERGYTEIGSVSVSPFGGASGPDMMMQAESDFLASLALENSRFDFKFRSKAA